jgi:AraC-like DNA-binding protein
MGSSYRELSPPPRLAQYIECYWFHEEHPGATANPILPDGCADLLFTTQNGQPAGLTVVGLMTAPLTLAPNPGRSFFAARFRPGMAASFIPEAALLNDRVEPLETFWGTRARAISDRLAESLTPELMADTMNAALRPLEPPGPTHRALCRLTDSDIPLNTLPAHAGLSERHFRRTCLERAGVSPKYMRRILRFRKAVNRLSSIGARSAQPNWAQFALACGYYDQAHMIREFQEFASCAPGRFVQSRNRPGVVESGYDEPTKTREPN